MLLHDLRGAGIVGGGDLLAGLDEVDAVSVQHRREIVRLV